VPVCLNIGEAAGVAAAQCVEKGENNVHKADTTLLREKLKQYGAYIL
jgi:hypothetical protein